MPSYPPDGFTMMDVDEPIGGVLLLNGLPARTQLTLDAHTDAYVVDAHFAGIKSLKPGWHCISWSPPEPTDASTAPPAALSPQSSLRTVTLRWFDRSDVVVRDLDRSLQRLVPPEPSTASSTPKRNPPRVSRSYDPRATQVSTVVTPDVLASVSAKLLPAPQAAQQRWSRIIRHLSRDDARIGRRVVARVIGVDTASGDVSFDSLTSGPSRTKDSAEEATLVSTGNVGRAENGTIVWGRSRPQAAEPSHTEVASEADESTEQREPNFEVAVDRKRKHSEDDRSGGVDAHGGDGTDGEALVFTAFDLRRSWPATAVGAELTRWSQDKSWLLRHVAARAWIGLIDSRDRAAEEEGEWYVPLVCEFELAFLVFVTAGNVYAWEQWLELLTLFCRSSSLLGAQSAFLLHPSTVSTSTEAGREQADGEVRLDAHTAFLETLRAQLDVLDADFWSVQATQTEEHAVIKQLDTLRATIARSMALAGVMRSVEEQDEAREKLVAAWRRLSQLSANKFGWQLDRRLDEEAEVEDDIEAEDGEDAPVVVEM